MKAELLLYHSKWMFIFGTDVGLGGLGLILQSSFWRL